MRRRSPVFKSPPMINRPWPTRKRCSAAGAPWCRNLSACSRLCSNARRFASVRGRRPDGACTLITLTDRRSTCAGARRKRCAAREPSFVICDLRCDRRHVPRGGRGRAPAAFDADVLLDEGGHPWLIEINDHPSLRVDLTLEEHKKATGHAGMPSAEGSSSTSPSWRQGRRRTAGPPPRRRPSSGGRLCLILGLPLVNARRRAAVFH